MKQKGFTLFELLFVVGVLTIIILAGVTIFVAYHFIHKHW